MTLTEFKESVAQQDQPPENLSEALQALWYERIGDWHRAHQIAQDLHSDEGAWVHAYLHRKEGDLGNARYWYSRAGRPESKKELAEEWEEIAGYLLAGP